MTTETIVPAVIGTSAGGIAIAMGHIVIEWVKIRKGPSAVRLDEANSLQAVATGFGSLVNDLQEDRRALRHAMKNLEMQVDAYERRLDEASIAARKAQAQAEVTRHRHDRNFNAMSHYAAELSAMVRKAGYEPPGPPEMEPDPELVELAENMQTLMGEVATIYDKPPRDR